MITIKILGTGCPKCKSLEKGVKEAVAEMNVDAEIVKVEDIVDIMKYNIIRTPGLVVNNKVVVSGHVPSVSEIKQLIK
jgi:small redox-active disulfide protein 2